MDTCSNCGASVRPGAKFCTGCGNRLNDVDTSGSGQSGWDETGPVADVPSSNESTVGRVVSTRVVTDGAADHAPRPTVSASEQPATTWTWGSLETDNPAARVPVTPAEDRESANLHSVAGEEPATEPVAVPSSEPFQWSWDTPSSGEPAAEANATDDVPPPIAEPMADSPPDNVVIYRPANASTTESPGSGTNLEAQTSGEDQVDRNAREAEIADMPPPYDWRQSVTYGYEEKSSLAANEVSEAVSPPSEEREEESLPVFAATGSDSSSDGSTQPFSVDPNAEPAPSAPSAPTDHSGAEARALDLLDELRSLIPALSAESAALQGQMDSGTTDVVNAAIQELDDATASVGDSSDLRAVLEAATTRPRDMDVVLELVGQAGSLIDLLDERDRLVAAVERAASALRASS